MKWNELTLWQYQQLMPILTNPNKDWTELDKEVKLLTIVTGLTEYQIDSLSIEDLKELRKDLAFLDEPIEGKPVDYITTNGKRYRINYDIKNMPSARYIESKVFSTDTLGNLHKIAASMVIPQKRNWYGKWIDDKYDASKHEQYAADMQEANFIHVYHSLVFFYQVYKNWIEVSRDYMRAEMTTAGMTTEQADSVLLLLCESMDGIIPPNLLPNTKILELQKLLK
ncbi:hypothetical protein UFOVP690_8 [uncultured Caudovirales phage]|uniref:Uncharacterized protein n=1 Tax=uncultured Caudovirales phage TaxID=2100421 RepID=A0A6J5NIB7_9CAUD|nr:hypothetical protein UFOVP690_8 [uncultured Caudovirales phage]